VTKLSLLLKVLEGETEESISSLLRYFKERALPDLGSNIKCGNSLIGYDYYDDHKNLSAEEMQRINAFEWKTEFPEVFERGGFDAVIGNPPYLRIQGLQENYQGQIDYFLNRYQSATKHFDFYWLGILNSLLMWWFLSNTGTVLRGGYFRFTHDYLEPFPVPDFDMSKSQDLARHDRLVELVQSMLDLHKRASSGTDHDKTLLARRIEATDRQIDRLVYEEAR